jgi:thiol-disulfide isomerase/thioredoxin
MKKLFFTIILIVSNHLAQAQEVKLIKWPDMEKMLHSATDTTYIFNFWATWCVPCVKELPYLLRVAHENKNKKIRLILISIDFKKQFESRLIPFVAEHNIDTDVFLLDEPDYNSWIDKVDSSWNGAIPATLILNNRKSKRAFYEKDFEYNEFSEIVKSIN